MVHATELFGTHLIINRFTTKNVQLFTDGAQIISIAIPCQDGNCENESAVPITKTMDEQANCDISLNLDVGIK